MRSSNFSYLVKQGVVSVWHNRVMSFASFCILMVSLLLIGLAVLISIDIGIIIGNIEDTNEILVFVDESVSAAELSYISEIISSYKDEFVDRVVYISPEEALASEREWYGENFFVLFDSIGENPMPSTYIVSLWDITKINEAVSRFEEIDGVISVSAPFDFAEILIAIRNTFAVIGLAILIALLIVCLVIIYNTTRSSVFARRMQISIMKHVGATNAFIRIPFFIEGMFIGILAGVASWGLTKLAYESVVSVFEEDIMLLQIFGISNVVVFDDIMWLALAANCLAGALLGAIGTVMSMGKHLKV
ncbi:MAG: permease-like cell division protein FtsX [Oscillospiraceae bacterium]|nr:permease-like cell division protein FtsX [Oscillospiraceae bacterium]